MKIELPCEPVIDTGHGDPLILLADPLQNLAAWSPLVYSFGETHRVLVPRLPFYAYPLDLNRAEEITGYLQKFLDAHGVERPVIIGEGMGSFMALLYAWHFPKHVKRLVLTNSPELSKSPFAVSSPVFQNDLSDSLADLHPETKPDDGRPDAVYSNLYGEPIHNVGYRSMVIPSLTQIATPVLLISGLQDTVTPPEVSLEFHDLLPCSKVIFMDHCSHQPVADQPQVFLEHVRNFIG